MKMDYNLAAVHAYLCADGYVTTNDKWKYYRAGLRNTNLILLKDFQEKFEKVFGVKPTIRKDGRCEKCSKEIYESLTKEFGSFYSWEWRMPEVNDRLARVWLRAYFDCEGWVTCKSHQNRMIGADCVNEEGIKQIKETLLKLGIKSKLKKRNTRNIFSLAIFGKENLEKFSKLIGFLHPNKYEKLKQVSNDFVVYEWDFPENEEECREFVLNKLKEKIRIKKPYYVRMFSREEYNLKTLQKLLNRFFDINCFVNRYVNGIGTVYYELSISRKEEVKKLINLGVITNLFKDN